MQRRENRIERKTKIILFHVKSFWSNNQNKRIRESHEQNYQDNPTSITVVLTRAINFKWIDIKEKPWVTKLFNWIFGVSFKASESFLCFSYFVEFGKLWILKITLSVQMEKSIIFLSEKLLFRIKLSNWFSSWNFVASLLVMFSHFDGNLAIYFFFVEDKVNLPF